MKAKPSLYAKFLSAYLSKLGILKVTALSNIAILAETLLHRFTNSVLYCIVHFILIQTLTNCEVVINETNFQSGNWSKWKLV